MLFITRLKEYKSRRRERKAKLISVLACLLIVTAGLYTADRSVAMLISSKSDICIFKVEKGEKQYTIHFMNEIFTISLYK